MNAASMVTNMSMLKHIFFREEPRTCCVIRQAFLLAAGRLRSRYLVDGGDLACETLSCCICFFSLFRKTTVSGVKSLQPQPA
jgi:hypothetical protein